MIRVYVETPFVVGHARKTLPGSQQLVDAAENQEFDLVVPVLSLFEALFEWRGTEAELLGHKQFLSVIASDLGAKGSSSAPDADVAGLLQALRQAPTIITSMIAADRKAVDDAIDLLSRIARHVLPVSPDHFQMGRQLERQGLRVADALIAAAIIADARAAGPGTKLFLALDGTSPRRRSGPSSRGAGIDTMAPISALMARIEAAPTAT